jgi:DNA-binding FadR family transcriptional regulator
VGFSLDNKLPGKYDLQLLFNSQLHDNIQRASHLKPGKTSRQVAKKRRVYAAGKAPPRPSLYSMLILSTGFGIQMRVEDIQPIEDINRIALIENRIKEYILEKGLRPGDKLPTEEQLANALQVGRTAVRETFRRLEALGIVESHQGFGRVVRDFNFDPILNGLYYGLVFHGHNIMQMLEIRRALDDFFIDAAIQHLQEEDLAQLETIVQRMIEGGDDNPDFHQEDHDFHALLYSRCGNPLAAQLFEITWKVRLHAADRHIAISKPPPGIVAEHAAILAAIQQRDVTLARKLLSDHHDSVAESLRSQIERQALHP